jgi:hypothetical protein
MTQSSFFLMVVQLKIAKRSTIEVYKFSFFGLVAIQHIVSFGVSLIKDV